MSQVTATDATSITLIPASNERGGADERYLKYKVLRRNGNVADFHPQKVTVAMTKAFIAVEGQGGEESSRIRDLVRRLTEQVVDTLLQRLPEGGVFHIEHIQDQVEIALMRAGEHEVARSYVLYRNERALHRKDLADESAPTVPGALNVTMENGRTKQLNKEHLLKVARQATAGLDGAVSPERIIDSAIEALYDGVKESDVWKSVVFSARALIEQEPDYTFVTARLLLHDIRREVLGEEVDQVAMVTRYPEYFKNYIRVGIKGGLLDEKLGEYDLEKIGAALKGDRDLKFQYLGLQTLYDRYLLHIDGARFELPQAFWMRVAMGLAMQEVDREDRAIEFYNLLSSFDFVSSTPTLFNSGTRRPQLSSCFLTTVGDDLSDIYDSIRENALLSKFSGGLGNDWTPVRALGSHIKGTNGKSQGVVPFLKVVNDTAVAVNQGGKRKGAVCCYLESWHLDIEEFLELRKNTGDDRRRTHDMNTANWIPDLFMHRVMKDQQWTLFTPDETPDLHNLYGAEFKKQYEKYEQMADAGQIKLFKRISAVSLWRKMLSMLFETGHPWITFKDACNLRSPQQHVGVVHSSNLCTEITLNTSDTETAVCNLGSVNLVAHFKDGELDLEKLSRTCKTAMRMLDNVIDINYYSVPKARTSNLKHRPVGLGLMGFQDVLLSLGVPYASKDAVQLADYTQEAVSYYAILASSKLAEERGAYASYKGSLWDRGILPIDSLDILMKTRQETLEEKAEFDRSSRLDWKPVRESIAEFGMRNSNCLAIAPTATIANIAGVSPSIEPTFQNLYVKSNLSGEFTVLNAYLVTALKERGLWDEVMIHDLKYFDGSVMAIERVPQELKAVFATAFEIDSRWLVECGARRQKWIDQAQSLNLYMAEPGGRKIDELYKMAWTKGLKTTYYLRTISATYAEKSTVDTGALNAVSNKAGARAESTGSSSIKSKLQPTASSEQKSAPQSTEFELPLNGQVCDPNDTECEACQ
jgi:ribonucleoside-diphosphate reductase alpha chain